MLTLKVLLYILRFICCDLRERQSHRTKDASAFVPARPSIAMFDEERRQATYILAGELGIVLFRMQILATQYAADIRVEAVPLCA